jgi:uncharacterized protein (TIGR02246 family)
MARPLFYPSPESAVAAFVEAINRGDLDAAVDCYEEGAVLVAQPGLMASGRDEIREALGGMLSMRPRIVTASFEVLRSADLALYHSRWTMAPADRPDEVEEREEGCSADVLRRQASGEWKIAIDNPWGTALLA